MSEKQAKYFALSIFGEVKKYVKEHRTEFEAWQQETEGKDDAF